MVDVDLRKVYVTCLMQSMLVSVKKEASLLEGLKQLHLLEDW